MRRSRSVAELQIGYPYLDETGRQKVAELDPTAGDSLRAFRTTYVGRLEALTGIQERGSVEDLVAGVRFICEVLSEHAIESDLALRVSASRAVEVRSTGKASADRRNDAVDEAQLQLVVRGILCTHDAELKRRAERSESFDAWRVMSPEELLTWLSNQIHA